MRTTLLALVLAVTTTAAQPAAHASDTRSDEIGSGFLATAIGGGLIYGGVAGTLAAASAGILPVAVMAVGVAVYGTAVAVAGIKRMWTGFRCYPAHRGSSVGRSDPTAAGRALTAVAIGAGTRR